MAIQIGLGHTSPLLLVALRLNLAAIAAVAVVVVTGRMRQTYRVLRDRHVWEIGGIYALGFVIQFVGQAWAGVANATLLSNLFPVFAPLIAVSILGEPLSRPRALALCLALAGLVAIASPSWGVNSDQIAGDALLLGSAMAFAWFIVLSKRNGIDSPSHALGVVVVMGVLVTPLVGFYGFTSPTGLAVPYATWEAAAYLAMPCTVFALSLYLTGLEGIAAGLSAMLLLLEPVVGLLLAAAFYHGAVTLPIVIGAVFIVSGLLAASWVDSRPNPSAASGRPAR